MQSNTSAKKVTLDRIVKAKIHIETWFENRYSKELFIVNQIILPFHEIARLEGENVTMREKLDRQIKMYTLMQKHGAFDYPEFRTMHPEEVVRVYIALVSEANERKLKYIQKVDRIMMEFMM